MRTREGCTVHDRNDVGGDLPQGEVEHGGELAEERLPVTPDLDHQHTSGLLRSRSGR